MIRKHGSVHHFVVPDVTIYRTFHTKGTRSTVQRKGIISNGKSDCMSYRGKQVDFSQFCATKVKLIWTLAPYKLTSTSTHQMGFEHWREADVLTVTILHYDDCHVNTRYSCLQACDWPLCWSYYTTLQKNLSRVQLFFWTTLLFFATPGLPKQQSHLNEWGGCIFSSSAVVLACQPQLEHGLWNTSIAFCSLA